MDYHHVVLSFLVHDDGVGDYFHIMRSLPSRFSLPEIQNLVPMLAKIFRRLSCRYYTL